jgi:hypothetical protein
MNIKTYLDYFDEISDLPRDEQFTLLDRAHQLIQDEGAISKFTLVSCLGPIMSVAALVSAGILLLGKSILIIIISVVFGLLLSRVVVNELNTSLLSRGLKQVIAANKGGIAE